MTVFASAIIYSIILSLLISISILYHRNYYAELLSQVVLEFLEGNLFREVRVRMVWVVESIWVANYQTSHLWPLLSFLQLSCATGLTLSRTVPYLFWATALATRVTSIVNLPSVPMSCTTPSPLSAVGAFMTDCASSSLTCLSVTSFLSRPRTSYFHMLP